VSKPRGQNHFARPKTSGFAGKTRDLANNGGFRRRTTVAADGGKWGAQAPPPVVRDALVANIRAKIFDAGARRMAREARALPQIIPAARRRARRGAAIRRRALSRRNSVKAEGLEVAGECGLARARSLGPRGPLLSAKFLSPVGFIAPAQSASRPLPLANPFRHFPMAQIPSGSSFFHVAIVGMKRFRLVRECINVRGREGIGRDIALRSPDAAARRPYLTKPPHHIQHIQRPAALMDGNVLERV